MKQTPLRRRTPLRSRRRVRREAPAGPWRAKVFAASDGRCVVTGERLTAVDDAHHVVEKFRLRQLGIDPHDDPRWGVGVKRRVHERHTLAVERIPYDKLPQAAIEVAAEHGLEYVLDRYYPKGAQDG